jgi:hypothetical protein
MWRNVTNVGAGELQQVKGQCHRAVLYRNVLSNSIQQSNESVQEEKRRQDTFNRIRPDNDPCPFVIGCGLSHASLIANPSLLLHQ